MSAAKQARGFDEMIATLEAQTDLLEHYAQHAFEEGDAKFLPEMATKLRLLVVRMKNPNHKPLLFEVAEQLGETPMVTLRQGPKMLRPAPGDPAPGDAFPLDQFFEMSAATVPTSAGQVTLTKRQLIRGITEQLGGAHADWAVEEGLAAAIVTIPLLNLQPAAIELRNAARTTVTHARRLIALGKARLSDGARADGA